MTSGRRTAAATAALAAVAVVLAGCGLTARPADRGTAPGSAPGPTPVRTTGQVVVGPSAPAGPARAALERLVVRPERFVDGYSRAAFGQRWADVDRNGCDTRNDVLRRDLTGAVLDPRTHGCVVRTGTLVDPYTGVRVAFVRGPATSPLVEVDHVVALAAAWRTGAADWTPQRREQFANDPLELLATTRDVNQEKGSLDAADWLPPLPAARCPFVARQVAVKAAWGLTVTPPEKAAMARVLATCPGQRLPGR